MCRWVLEHHPHRPLPDLRGKPARSRHGPILSRIGASGKAGAVHEPASSIALERIAPPEMPAYTKTVRHHFNSGVVADYAVTTESTESTTVTSLAGRWEQHHAKPVDGEGAS